MRHFQFFHDKPCLPPHLRPPPQNKTTLHNLCFLKFCLSITVAPKENKDNAYAKFWDMCKCRIKEPKIESGVESELIITVREELHYYKVTITSRFFERAICSRKRYVETSRREEEMGRVKGSGEGAGREKRKVFFLPFPSPVSFFRPRTYRKGYYFYSPQSSTVIKSKMAATTILRTQTRFRPPKIRLHCRLVVKEIKAPLSYVTITPPFICTSGQQKQFMLLHTWITRRFSADFAFAAI